MYKKILVTLENSRTDEAILRHIELLAKPLGSHLLLVHVADGWMARHRDRLNLAESEEMRIDRAYLESVRARFEAPASRPRPSSSGASRPTRSSRSPSRPASTSSP